MGMGWERYIIL